MSKKYYKLREDLTIEICGVKLFRIEATKDIEQHGVKKGDLGGYVEKEENLSDSAWVSGDACVSGSAWVFGSARVYGDARVSDSARVYGDARVSDSARVYGSARVSGDAIEKSADCRNINNEMYNITILPEYLQIGCQYHSKQEWWNFSDREILSMDGKDGLRWWRKWKPILMAICEEVKDGE